MKSLLYSFLASVSLVLGAATVLGQTSPLAPLWQVDSAPNGPSPGRHIWRIGDVDQDGADDLAVFLTTQWVPDEIQILSGATGAVIHSYVAASQNPALEERFGKIIPRIHDQDGDGVDDFIVVAAAYDINTGSFVSAESRIMSGVSGAVIRTLPSVVSPIRGVADYDGDGLGDILNVTLNSGQVYSSVGVYSSVTGQLVFQTTGTVPFGGFGWDVEVIGDVNGDGWDDWVTTELNLSYPGDPSFVHVISGLDGTFLFSVSGTSSHPFGHDVARAGDLNGDSVPDFAVQAGIPLQIEIRSGVDGTLIQTVSALTPLFLNGVSCSWFGATLVGGEDLDGDAVPDLVIGDPRAPNASGDPSAGRIYLVSGGTWTLTEIDQGGFAQNYFGCGFGLGLGESLAMLGDVNGDGLADVAVGAPNQLVNPNQYGFVRCYAGQPWTSDAARSGNVNASGPGGVVDVLRVDPGMTGQASAGQGTSRSLDLAVGLPFSLHMAAPPAGPGIAPYVLWGQVSEALVFQAVTLPFGVGDMAITPPFLAPGDPTLFTLSDTFSYANQLLVAFPAVGPGTGIAVASVPTGIPFPVTFTLQGVILDASSPVGVSVTNALRLHVE